VKLTNRGQEFLVGTLLSTAIATIFDQYIFLALCLSLSLAATASLLLFLSRDPSKLSIIARPELVRLLKGESVPVELAVASGASSWLSLSSALAPSASGFSFENVRDQRGKFTVGAKYAGRYTRLSLSARFVDVLELFERTETVRPQTFIIEVLPHSLTEPPSKPNLVTVTSGEVPAGLRGGGQEFYGLEPYTGVQESRDILWRRVARSPDQSISARLREANIPGTVAVSLVEAKPADRPVWMDAATEAMGRIGVTLIELGIAFEVIVPGSNRPTIRATNANELADLLMEMWKYDDTDQLPALSEIPYGPVLTGSSVLSDQALSDLTNRVSTFIVPDGSPWDKLAQGGFGPRVRGLDDFVSVVILS
jgi:hypothetical protein